VLIAYYLLNQDGSLFQGFTCFVMIFMTNLPSQYLLTICLLRLNFD